MPRVVGRLAAVAAVVGGRVDEPAVGARVVARVAVEGRGIRQSLERRVKVHARVDDRSLPRRATELGIVEAQHRERPRRERHREHDEIRHDAASSAARCPRRRKLIGDEDGGRGRCG